MLRDNERGFTLIEMVSVMALIAVLLTVSVSALRPYWFGRAMDRAEGELVAEMRQTQQRVVAETHPLVYGVWFRSGTPDWGVVAFDPKDASTSTDDVCTTDARFLFDGAFVSDIQDGDTTSSYATTCASVAPGATFVFFYAKGTATRATITLEHEQTGKTKQVSVTPLTARIEGQG
ncbi:MAG TPA: type II secretion system protein [Actinomycetota bacterium]|nr:type II secretion system protein [Actinomycetota bacterium]